MQLKELSARIKQANPALEKIPDNRLNLVLRAAFKLILDEIEAASDKPVVVASLGRFRVRVVEREKDGSKWNVKHIVYKPADADAGAKGKAGAAKRQRA